MHLCLYESVCACACVCVCERLCVSVSVSVCVYRYEDCQENTDVLSPVAKDPSISEKNWEENDSSDRSL